MIAYGILILGWCVFFFLHSWLASNACKNRARSKMGETFRYYRLWYSMVAFVTLGGVLAWQFSIPVHTIEVNPFVKYFIAAPCAIIGAALMAVCIKKYFFKLSGVQVFSSKKMAPSLETGGVHRFVRHPLYIGTLLLVWGLCCYFPTLANMTACTLITIYVRIGISLEENKLLQIFGDEYMNYKRRTPMLIPGIGKLEKDGKTDLRKERMIDRADSPL